MADIGERAWETFGVRETCSRFHGLGSSAK
jgi:hypothetical protein